MKIKLTCDVEDYEIIEAIETLSREQILSLIKNLDNSVCDWDFTNELYEYFKELHENFLKEEAEKSKMYRVYQDHKPADCHNYKVHKSWDNSLFESKREAEIYAFKWAYPIDEKTTKLTTPTMELNKFYNYSSCEFPVNMMIREEDIECL